MKFFLFVLFLVNISANESKIKYDGYIVYRLMPFTNEQLEELKLLAESDSGFDFWQGPTTLNQPVDIMVAPRQSSAFQKLINNLRINVGLFIPDVQSLINETYPKPKPGESFAFDWTTYYRLADIYAWMDSLAAQYPTKVQVIVAGKSYEGRDIKGVKVSLKSGNKAVFVEGGIHAREWIAPATVTYILNQLLTSTKLAVTTAAKNYDWYFFPVVNPDGYEYTFTKDRLWRKTRKPYSRFCKGADPNRNWGYHWMNGGSSSNPCSDTYAGPSAFSEPETKALSNFITSIQSNLIGYLAFHSYSQLILISYGDSPAHVENYNELFDIGTLAATSLAQKYGTKYTVGNIMEILYRASGTSMDWVKGTYHTPITFTFELRDKGQNGFLLPSNQIVPTGEETLDAFVTIIQEAEKRGY